MTMKLVWNQELFQSFIDEIDDAIVHSKAIGDFVTVGRLLRLKFEAMTKEYTFDPDNKPK